MSTNTNEFRNPLSISSRGYSQQAKDYAMEYQAYVKRFRNPRDPFLKMRATTVALYFIILYLDAPLILEIESCYMEYYAR